MTEEFYSPASINFSREQVIWLIKHFNLLIDGIWPSDHKVTGYTGKKHKVSHVSYFETTKQVMAELVPRIERIGRDALPLLFAFTHDADQQIYVRDMLASCLRVEPYELDERVEDAITYITGSRAKKMGYVEWKKQKAYLHKTRHYYPDGSS